MKRILSWYLMFLFLLISTSCSLEEVDQTKEEYESLIHSTKEYQFPVVHYSDIDALLDDESSFLEKKPKDLELTKFNVKGAKLTTPSDVISTKQGLLFVDVDGNQLVLTDTRGKVLRVIGKTGNGADEFLTPTAVTRFKDQYYVIDEGNHRIKVLDADFRYLRSIQIPYFDLDADKRFNSIAVDSSGTVYVSGNHIYNAGIYRAASNETSVSKMVPYFVGSVSSAHGHIFALNQRSVYVKPEIAEIGTSSSRNYFCRIQGKELTKERELPSMLQVTSFLVGKKLYVLSDGWQGVFAFEKDSDQYQMLVSLKNKVRVPSAMTMLGRDIYITDPQNHQILKVEGVE